MTAAHGRPAVFLDRDGVLTEAYVRDGVPTPPRDAGGVPGAARRRRGVR